MKPLLFVLLAASLAANIVLALRSGRSPSSVATSAPSSSATATAAPEAAGQTATGSVAISNSRGGGTAAVAPAPVGAVWRSAVTEADLHRVVADLRAAGYPPEIVRAVMQQLLKTRFAAREPNAGQPYWKHSNQTPDAVAAQNAVNNERRELLEALLGDDARPSAMLDAETRLRRYGPISEEKIDLLAKIERDYNEMSAEAWAKRRGNIVVSNDTLMQTQQLMEQEKFADMAAVLTPEELREYELRNSQAARTLINNLRNVDITETEYARLYQAQKAFNDANPRRTTMDASSFSQRQTAQMALNEEARTVLGDERFYPYLEGSDYQYASVAKAFVAHPAVTPAVAYQVYQLQNELQAVMVQASRDGPPSQEKVAEMRTVVESYNARLETLIGAEAAEAYRKQGNGRMFSSFRNMPRPAGQATQATGR
jgi:hypothetical protein